MVGELFNTLQPRPLHPLAPLLQQIEPSGHVYDEPLHLEKCQRHQHDQLFGSTRPTYTEGAVSGTVVNVLAQVY